MSLYNQTKNIIKTLKLTEKCAYSTSTITKGGKQGMLLSRKLLSVSVPNEVEKTVDEWVKNGNAVKRHDIIVCVGLLRKENKYLHALQLHEWMEKGKIQMNNADQAIHIDLLGKTKGIESAEEYFTGLKASERTKRTYGALLGCYCKEKKTDKAKELFEKMKVLGFTSSLNFNNMMNLYLKIGEPEKVPLLEKEMEKMEISLDLYTYNQLIDSYSAVKDFDAVDGIVEKVRKNKLEPDWLMLGNVASIYVNAGLVERATVALKNLEDMNNIVRGVEGFQTLITLYGRMNDPVGVNRAWEGLKSKFKKPRNESYLIMLLALSTLNDVNGIEKWFTEWESNCTFYDVRLANVMLESYLNRNMIDEANALYERVIAREAKPNLRTVDLFTNYHLKDRNIDLALKFLETGASDVSKRISTEKNVWFPSEETVKRFLELIEEAKEDEIVEKFYGIMGRLGRSDLILKLKEDDQVSAENNGAGALC